MASEGRSVWSMWVGWIAAGAIAWGGGMLVTNLLVGVVARFVGPYRVDEHAIGIVQMVAQGMLLVVAIGATLGGAL